MLKNTHRDYGKVGECPVGTFTGPHGHSTYAKYMVSPSGEKVPMSDEGYKTYISLSSEHRALWLREMYDSTEGREAKLKNKTWEYLLSLVPPDAPLDIRIYLMVRAELREQIAHFHRVRMAKRNLNL